MRRCRLDMPDHPAEHADPGYSAAVADALITAYTHLDAGRPKLAGVHLVGFLARSMSAMQRVRVLYVLALHEEGEQRHVQARALVDEAIHQARILEDLPVITTLAYLGAAVRHNLQEYADAAAWYASALAALHAQVSDTTPLDPLMEFDVLAGLANEAYLQADLEAASRYVDAAGRLPLAASVAAIRRARLKWTLAIIERMHGHAGQALEDAMAALDIYATLGTPIERARLQIVVANIYLDLACPSTAESPLDEARQGFLTLAEPLLARALAMTRQTRDRAGEGLARLGYARFCWLAVRQEDVLMTIAEVEALASDLHDLPLLGQAHVARGDYFAAHGQTSAALSCYAEALQIFERSGAAVYRLRAQRARHLAEIAHRK